MQEANSDRLRQLQNKYDQANLQKQQEVAKSIQYQLKLGYSTLDDKDMTETDEITLIKDKAIQKHIQTEMKLIDRIAELES